MDITTGIMLINKDTRRSSAIMGEKEAFDHWWGGSKPMYLVDDRWLTSDEVSEQYLIVGVNNMHVASEW